MELVLSPGRIGGGEKNGSPFQNEEVREWSHVDRLTGMLEHARIETGRWQTRHQGSAQAYGKVIDSRERNSADGNVVQKARRQVEVFQSQGVSGRSVQVVRASQWSSSRITDSTSSSPVSVSMTESQSSLRNGNDEIVPGGKSLFRRVQQCDDDQSLTKLSQVSRLCRQINTETGVGSFGNLRGKQSPHVSPLLGNRFRNLHHDFSYREYDGNVSNLVVTNSPKKSTSNEDLTKSVDNANARLKFNRDCKARRSLQIQKSSEVTTSSIVKAEDPVIEIPLHFNSYENNETRTMNGGVQVNEFGDKDLASSDKDVRNVAKNGDRKKLKSYVLGMQDESDSDSSLTVESKYLRNGERLFNGVAKTGEENCVNKEVGKCQYLKPTPILLKPVKSVQLTSTTGMIAKANTTVVHLNNAKAFPDPETDQSKVDETAGKLQSDKTSVNGNDESNAATISRSVKRVGFCKTEVHFAAESGKVNIVETDCKPPPSNRYRRRRRSNIVVGLPATNKNLPLIHFGDTTYEKYIFGQSNGSIKTEFKNGAVDKFLDNQPEASAVLRDEQRLQIPDSDDLPIKDGWSARLKTILQSEPATIDQNDDLNAHANFDGIDETIAVDHTFKGHTTTVNLGANGLSKLMQKHANEDRMKIEESSNEGKDNQLQYSSGSEQADEEVRSYMLGSQIHHKLHVQHKKFLHSIAMEKSRNVRNSKELHLGPSTVNERKDINCIDVIDQNIVSVSSIDEDDLETGNSGLPVEEIFFESNGTVEKNHVQGTILNERNVITSDNENNKVLLNIVTTHEPVIARVEESHSVETRRELFAGKKLHSHSENVEENRNNAGESSRVSKSFSTRIRKTSTKHKTKEHCDNALKKEVETGCCLKNDTNTTDPTYVNVFERKKEKSIPIYENCYVNNRKRNLNDKKYSKNMISGDIQSLAELKTVTDNLTQSTNGDCDSESASLSNTDCEDENFTPSSRARDADAKLATISENTNSGKVNNRESHKVKQSRIKSKRAARPPSSVSSIESVHRISVSENTNVSEVKSLHSKSTRSSRLRSRNNQEKIPAKESAERYSSDDKKNNTIERTSNSKISRSNHAINNITKASYDQTGNNLNASIRSKKPIEIVYETAVFNMKNEKLAKSSRAKESKTPRYINDLICGSKPKRSNDMKHVKGAALCQQRVHHKSVSPTNRHWK
ncbi:uncharacterized protein LOC124183869 isoform X1 [Neodiprion fabricii]|uniref:uncharacterized protein LOC124183869 isoform X1 n=1 Tax=Neodiprion fabricii TaxID=2872261 RepID=UPI001ED8EC55|nr:uncharacterized protein LOC124183869 isoform X1 [Neodiprion fabricii]